MAAVRSLRGRVALLATLAVGAVLLAVGVAAVTSFADRERARIDQTLRDRPAGALVRALSGEGFRGPPDRSGPGPGPLGPEALRPEGEYVRLVADGELIRAVDAPEELPLPPGSGIRTLEADGQRFRSLTRAVPGGGLLEVGTDLSPADDRIAGLRNRLLLLGALALVLVAALSWWLAGLALRPLRALREAAGRVSTTRDLSTRLSAGDSPDEVAELTESINAMLARLERSAAATEEALQATRRFAGDAGHELRTPMTALRANLGALRRNPDLEPAERLAALEQAEREAERAGRMLEALQTLARGEAGSALPSHAVDLSALAEAAVDGARSRHPEVEWELTAPPEELELTGWPDGLRALLDNLLDNAARHGRPGGRAQVALERAADGLVVTVDDDGPGVDEPDRERIFERFARGEDALAEGSGLGLALVRQQARLHGGEATVSDSPLGGARFRVTLAAAGGNGAAPESHSQAKDSLA